MTLERDGSFRARDLLRGLYRFRVRCDGCRASEFVARLDRSDPAPLELRVPPATSGAEVFRSRVFVLGLRAPLPRAVALVAIADPYSFRIRGVHFIDPQPVVIPWEPFSDPAPAFVDRDWSALVLELLPFFSHAIDVRRGPERFFPYLPADMRAVLAQPARKFRLYFPPEVIAGRSDDELRRLLAMVLDLQALAAWSELEELPGPEAPAGRSAETMSYRAWVDALETQRKQTLAALERAGALDDRHLLLASTYLRRYLGEGLVAKEFNHEGYPSAPRTAEVYHVRFGSFHLHFYRIEGKLRVIGATVP